MRSEAGPTWEDRPVDGRLLTRPFAVAWASTFGLFMAIGMLLPVLPVFAKGPLGAGSIGVGIAVAAASPTAFLLQPFAGRLGDLRGRRLLVVVGSLTAAATVVLYVVVDSLPALVALRLATGAGEALVFVGTATVINDLAPDHRRGEAVSLYSLAVWGGLAAGPLLGELALGEDRFELVWLLAAACSTAAGLIGLRLPETRPAAADDGPPVRAHLVHRAALGPGAVLIASIFGLASMTAFAPLYARSLGLDGAGLVFALNAIVVVAIRSVGRRIPDRAGPRGTAVFAVVITAVGLAIVASIRSPAGLYAGTVVLAVGQALTFPALMTLVVSAAPPAERSSAVGSFSACADLGYAIGAVSMGVVAAAIGYSGVFAVAACVVAIGLVPLSRMGRPRLMPAAAAAVDAPP
jgi:MFS family permease